MSWTLLLILVIGLLFISLCIVITMETKKTLRKESQKNTFLRLYLLIISIIAIGGATISLGFFIYPTVQKAIITDEEYAINNWQYSQCEESDYKNIPVAVNEIDTTYETEEVIPTDEEIKECQQKAIEKLKIQRNFEYKDTITVALSRFLLFTILFATHFPFFIKQNKEK